MNKLSYILLVCIFSMFCCKQKTENIKTEISSSKKQLIIRQEQNVISPKKWLITVDNDSFKENNLPFFFETFFKDNIPEIIYPYYKISQELKDFLIKNDYEGEEYNCFLLPSIYNLNVFLIDVLRGDSSYYIILLADSKEIKDMKEIGHIGDESNISTFDIGEDYIIKKYKGFREGKTILKKISITKEGEFIAIKE